MGVESRNVPTDSCKFPTEQMWLFEILFCHKFSQNVEIAAPNYVFSATTVPDRNVPTDRLKFNKGGGNCPSALRRRNRFSFESAGGLK